MKKVILIFVTIVLSGLLYAKDNKSTDALLREIDGIIKNPHWPGRCGQKVNCPEGAREAALGRRPLR